MKFKYENNTVRNCDFIFEFKVGDKLPNAELYENTPGNKVNILDVVSGKKVVLFGVPGAFTPGCSKVSDCQMYNVLNKLSLQQICYNLNQLF